MIVKAPKPRVVLIYGGRNIEHQLSRATAETVLRHLDRDRYEVTQIYITPDGEWVTGPDGELLGIEPAFGVVESIAAAMPALVRADVAMPMLHGRYGEDGSLQGLLAMAGTPFVGSDVFASAAAMDREFTRKLLTAEGIPVAHGVVLRDPARELGPAERDVVGLPAFVRPARGRSGVGFSRIEGWNELPAAVATARQVDSKVLVEAALPGRRIDVAVLEQPDGRLVTGAPWEITAGQAQFDRTAECPLPPLDPDVTQMLSTTAVEVFRLLGSAGLLQVGFVVNRDPPASWQLTVNEVNTMPALAIASQFPTMWQAAGIPYAKLVDTLLSTAMITNATRSRPRSTTPRP